MTSPETVIQKPCTKSQGSMLMADCSGFMPWMNCRYVGMK